MGLEAKAADGLSEADRVDKAHLISISGKSSTGFRDRGLDMQVCRSVSISYNPKQKQPLSKIERNYKTPYANCQLSMNLTPLSPADADADAAGAADAGARQNAKNPTFHFIYIQS